MKALSQMVDVAPAIAPGLIICALPPQEMPCIVRSIAVDCNFSPAVGTREFVLSFRYGKVREAFNWSMISTANPEDFVIFNFGIGLSFSDMPTPNNGRCVSVSLPSLVIGDGMTVLFKFAGPQPGDFVGFCSFMLDYLERDLN